MDKKISFIGLGAMGGPMATNIIKKGIELFVYDIDENKKNKVVKEGGLASNNILDAVKDSDIVITMLPATEQVKTVLLGENGVINNLKKDSLILDMSTISPKGTDEVAKKCRENLLLDNLGTKILPEAYTWHFAGTWDHMPELVKRHNNDLSSAFNESESILKRAVALPISVAPLDDDVPVRIRSAIEKGMSR